MNIQNIPSRSAVIAERVTTMLHDVELTFANRGLLPADKASLVIARSALLRVRDRHRELLGLETMGHHESPCSACPYALRAASD